jgi:hypothetical protein
MLSTGLHLDDSLGMLQAKMCEHKQAPYNRATATIRHAHNVGLDVLVYSTLEKSRDDASGDLGCNAHALKPENRR